jgi:oligopeptidase A
MAPPLPFDRISAADVKPAIATLLQQARARNEEIAGASGPRTWQNTMGALDTATDPLDLAVAVVRHLEGVVTTPELREAWNEVQPDISAFYSGIPLHAGLWAALNEYAATEEAKFLTGVRARFLSKTLDAFRRHGAALPPEGKKRLEALDV